ARSFSRRSVMPVTAECTMSTRAPSARRAAATLAMLRQLASEETLVPPNLRTIQSDAVRVTKVFPQASGGEGDRRVRPRARPYVEQSPKAGAGAVTPGRPARI